MTIFQETRSEKRLEQDASGWIESRPDVLAGEPVLKGTRIAARHVAELSARGASADEIIDELEITREQIDAAVAFDRANPLENHSAIRRSVRVPAP